jgi:peptidoglycan/LPS O-acetylase OafA/YrhL
MKFGVTGFPPALGVSDLGVDLFFVISGFIMVYTSESLYGRAGGWKTFMTRRVIRIVPIYWLTTLAALAYILVRQRASDMEPASVFYSWIAASFLFVPFPRTSGDVVPISPVATVTARATPCGRWVSAVTCQPRVANPCAMRLPEKPPYPVTYACIG